MTDERPTHLDLFSGIGGFALAAQWAGFRTIGFCEIDKYCQRVLAKNFLSDAARIQQGRQIERAERERARTPSEPIIVESIRELDGREFAGVSLITGGFPCQPFSCAGKRRGKEDDRHLWPEMLRVIAEARPDWIVGENVTGIIGMELDQVLSDLENLNYACQAFVIPACAVDAPHRRMRVWIVAKSNAERCGRWENHEGQAPAGRNGPASASDVADDAGARPAQHCEVQAGHELSGRHALSGSGCDVGNAELARLERHNERNASAIAPESQRADVGAANLSDGRCEWEPEPDVGRVAHGIPARVDRLRGLGNAIVPQVAYQILKAINNG